MKIKYFQACAISTAVTLAMSTAYAQENNEQSASAEQKEPASFLEQIVVTGVSRATTKIKSSVSTSTIDSDAISKSAPLSVNELFRAIPGVLSEASSGEANGNISFRGIPPTSGAKYVQLQEDGLPVLEFGDIAFGNIDNYMRADFHTARVEALRGGTGAIMVSNGPGGVINFISNTGDEDGGGVGVTWGVNYDQFRTDFAYGGELTNDWRFHVGGFWRQGEGPRDSGFDGNDGGQIRANFTRELDNGFIRFHVKHLDDKVQSYLPFPMKFSGSMSDPSFSNIEGFDRKRDIQSSAFLTSNLGLDDEGNRRIGRAENGPSSKQSSIGFEFDLDVTDTIKLVNKMRVTRTSGEWFGPISTGDIQLSQDFAQSIAGEGASAVYFNGANAGQVLDANTVVSREHLFDVDMENLDSANADFKVIKAFDLDSGTLDLTAGYYRSTQNINMSWFWNTYALEVKGDNAALVSILDAQGNAVSSETTGVLYYGHPLWGNCCNRSYDMKFTTDAPYLNLVYTGDDLTIDGGVRFDSGEARGSYAGNVSVPFDIDNNGVIEGPESSVAVFSQNRNPVNWDWSYTSFSIGANYQIDSDLAVFARISDGGRAVADRAVFTPFVDPLTGDQTSDDSTVDFVKQLEGGVKFKGDIGEFDYSLFLTLFASETEEKQIEPTTQIIVNRTYESEGLEAEFSASIGSWDFIGGITFLDSEITEDRVNPASEGNIPRRTPDYFYQFTATYTYEDMLEVGGNIIGIDDTFSQDDNAFTIPGYSYVNLFANYFVTEDMTLSVNVNNAFDDFGVTEVQGFGQTVGDYTYMAARGITGRTATVSLRYVF